MSRAPVRPKVAFQGEPGAFSHEAVMQLAGPRARIHPCPRFEDVFVALRDRLVDAAVIPIENTLHGSVHENYDHLLHFDHHITGETNVRIVHNLIAAPGVRFSQLRRVFSHPVALNQCLNFLAANPQLERTPFYDTAGSVRDLQRSGDRHTAALASRLAAEVYGMHVLREGLEDDKQNFTRFLLLGREPATASGESKTSIVFALQNQPGALFRALACFALRDIDLTKIESRPLPGLPWKYRFYLDFLGRAHDERSQRALAHLSEMTTELRVLGSYPRGG